MESTNDDLQHSAIDSAAQEETQTAQNYQGCLVLVYSAHDLWVANRIDYGRVAFQEILKDQNPFVNRLRPRTRLLGKFLLPTYEMNDLPTVVSFTAAILLMAAIVPWSDQLKRILLTSTFC